MRKGILLGLMMSWAGIWLVAQQCLPGGITFTSQQEIDDFAGNYPGCTLVQGNVTIQEAVPGDIVSLAGLSQVTEIGGYLLINETSGLTDLTGLENVTGIFGNLSLYNNTALVDLSGLESLTLVGRDLRLLENTALTSLTGLNALTTVGEVVNFSGNEQLVNLNGLNNLTFIGGDLRLINHTALESLDGLNNLATLNGNLNIGISPALTSIAALGQLEVLFGHIQIGQAPLASLVGIDHLTSLVGDLQLSELPLLPNLDDLSGITSIGGSFELSQLSQLEYLFTNSALTSIGGLFQMNNCNLVQDFVGLENLSSIFNFSMIYNDLLTDFSGLEGLSAIDNIFTIIGNDNLQSFNGLHNVSSIGGRVLISRNLQLTDLTGFSALTSIGDHLEIDDNNGLLNLAGAPLLATIVGDVRIEKNALLLNFNGLEGLNEIGGQLEISLNSDLENLGGLDNLTTVGGRLYIDQNHFLTSIAALGNVTSILGIAIHSNDRLASLNGLEGVTSLAGALEILGNNELGNLSGLDNLMSVTQHVWIWNNNGLLTLEGLESFTTAGSFLQISNNPNLTSLTGLDNLATVAEGFYINRADIETMTPLANLTYIGTYFRVQENELLISLAGTENIDFSDIDYIEIIDNSALNLCSQENVCNYLLSGGEVIVENNAPGCNDVNELLTGCFADQPHNNLVGRVLADTDPNCAGDPDEIGTPGWLVSVSSDDLNYAVSTDSQGYYWLPVLQGDYTLNVVSPSSFWASCFVDTLVQFTSFGDTTTTDFFVQPQGDCPYLEWDVTVPPLRICQTRRVTVDYCNYGALPAEDAVFTVQLDPLLTLDSASIDYTVDTDGLLIFELPTVDLFTCGQFTLDVFTDCEEAMIGDMPCLEVNLLSDALCAPDSLWDGSLITASGRCENDSIYFLLENIGTGDMVEPAQFRVEIVIDDIILMLEADDYQLPTGQTQMLAYAADGEGLRLEADQTPGHPLYTEVSAVVPNCETMGTDSLLMLLPSMDGDPFSGTFCADAVNSYDPNIKTAIPAGVGPANLIDRDWPLEYTIQFQNTGNDVAYEVVIADTISELLDLSTLDVKGASHDFTWTLTPERALTFTFADILLPDSTSNEPASHGFVAFTIAPVTDILPGDELENTAHIYFDFNDAIVTNTVLHTIRKPVVATSERIDWCTGDLYEGQSIGQDTTWQWLTEYALYDSVHFVHLKVLPVIETAENLELPVGSYFENILLTADTSFQLAYTAQNGCDSLVNYSVSVITSTETPAAFARTQIFPNPTADELRVLRQTNALPQTWTLRNGLGKVLWQRELAPYEQLPTLRLGAYPAGVYWLEVHTPAGTKSWKAVKA